MIQNSLSLSLSLSLSELSDCNKDSCQNFRSRTGSSKLKKVAFEHKGILIHCFEYSQNARENFLKVLKKFKNIQTILASGSGSGSMDCECLNRIQSGNRILSLRPSFCGALLTLKRIGCKMMRIIRMPFCDACCVI